MKRTTAPRATDLHSWICLLHRAALSIDPANWDELQDLVDFLHWYRDQGETQSIGLIEIDFLGELRRARSGR